MRNEARKDNKILKKMREKLTFSNVLWVLVTVALMTFSILYMNTVRTEVKIKAMTELNLNMKESIHGEYEDKEIIIRDLRYISLNGTDKKHLVSTLKSIIEYEYYEFADTVYDTTIEFKPFSIVLKFDAVYKDYNVHANLGVEEWKKLTDTAFLEYAHEYINENFEYKIRKELDIQTFVEEKTGQCYSYSEIMFLLGKERGMDVRVELSDTHSWNSYIGADGEEIEFDMTSKLEVVESEK